MDSGNSGSMQSSSGGDEEYDSRAESMTAFLNPSGHFGPISNPQPPALSHQNQHHHQPSLFDHHPSTYLETFSQSPASNPNANTLFNLDVVWSRGLRSDPNCTGLGNLTPSSSSSLSLSSSSTQSLLGAQGPSQGPFPSSSSIRSIHDNGTRASPHSDQTNTIRNSKKRTRASRRAPTTVLTTDTSNFRAMVQEFTGIPAPPFSASPYSRRLDLFGTGSATKSGHLETLGPLYPLRPSAQKVHQSPFVSSSLSPSFLNSSTTVVDAIAPTNIASTSNNAVTTSIAAATTHASNSTNNYQLPSDLGGLTRQPQNVLTMQNQMLTFQPLLQSPFSSPLKYPLANVPGFGGKSQASSSIHSLEAELGMNHEHVNASLSGYPGHVTSAGMPLRSVDNNLTSWRDGVQLNDGSQDHLRSFNGNYGNSQRVSSCKLNCSTSSSDFHPEKGPENVPSRGEGTVDSWICSSD